MACVVRSMRHNKRRCSLAVPRPFGASPGSKVMSTCGRNETEDSAHRGKARGSQQGFHQPRLPLNNIPTFVLAFSSSRAMRRFVANSDTARPWWLPPGWVVWVTRVRLGLGVQGSKARGGNEVPARTWWRQHVSPRGRHRGLTPAVPHSAVRMPSTRAWAAPSATGMPYVCRTCSRSCASVFATTGQVPQGRVVGNNTQWCGGVAWWVPTS